MHLIEMCECFSLDVLKVRGIKFLIKCISFKPWFGLYLLWGFFTPKKPKICIMHCDLNHASATTTLTLHEKWQPLNTGSWWKPHSNLQRPAQPFEHGHLIHSEEHLSQQLFPFSPRSLYDLQKTELPSTETHGAGSKALGTQPNAGNQPFGEAFGKNHQGSAKTADDSMRWGVLAWLGSSVVQIRHRTGCHRFVSCELHSNGSP